METAEVYPIPSRYVFKKEMPLGVLGRTARFEDKETGKFFICKSIEKDRLSTKEKRQKFIGFIERVKSLKNPNILSFENYYENSKYYAFLRPFIQEQTLTERISLIAEEDSISLFEIWKAIFQCFSFLHSHDLYPNVIKPNNIFILNDSDIILTDLYPLPFDIDLMISSPSTFNVGFLAPEYFKGETDVGYQADLWSLGVLLTFMLTKSLPWQSKNVFTMLHLISSGNIDFAKPISPEMSNVIRNLLQQNPSDRRFQNVSGYSPSKKVQIFFEGTKVKEKDSKQHKSSKCSSGRLSNAGFMVLKKGNSRTTKSMTNLLGDGNFQLRNRPASRHTRNTSLGEKA
ncbi:CAMK family protein kinase [Histomonas meleagridis]|uniref:CAMK family protein kinase n=1 Tax=Histomonas meleagridis TaxID=135588 RepID=UPI00355A5C68|nr:CAMK family protein kinase [Histomonas meleagridis]KAH0798012.1 CAMK family protein kinase [Histomonas meleagridis]